MLNQKVSHYNLYYLIGKGSMVCEYSGYYHIMRTDMLREKEYFEIRYGLPPNNYKAKEFFGLKQRSLKIYK
jgi:hypothetical protein